MTRVGSVVVGAVVLGIAAYLGITLGALAVYHHFTR